MATPLLIAKNNSAELSVRGYSLMVERAKDNRQLARVVWNRPDIPRPHLVELFETVRAASSPTFARQRELRLHRNGARLTYQAMASRNSSGAVLIVLPGILWWLAVLLSRRFRSAGPVRVAVVMVVLYAAPFVVANADPRFRIPLDVFYALSTLAFLARDARGRYAEET